jgi:pseudouridine 5'-phosphatase
MSDRSREARRPLAVIFDLDGTLLDTEPLYTQSTQDIAARYGKRFDWELKRLTMGGDAEFGARLVVERLGLPLSPESYLQQRYAILKRLFVQAPAMPGAEECVARLHQHGVAVAIGTSSFSELCDIKWAHHPWLSTIPVRVCGDDPEVTARKPAPDIFLIAARRLGIAPQECVVFEDSPAGVAAARAAGMRVIALRAPQLDARYVADADAIINHFDELDWALLGL